MSPSDTDMAECCVCTCTYDRTNRAPVSINCGHTFCKCCIPRFINNKQLSCPVCRAVSIVGDSGFQKNLALIQALDKLKLLASDDSKENSAPNVRNVKKAKLPRANRQEQQQQRVNNNGASNTGNWILVGRWVRRTHPVRWDFIQEDIPFTT
uniref:RING-type domain-containing protein n=1 Tax=Panagrellus redivivus TaxID=6233 RepID=A0A7E4ZR25_PANRE